MRERTEIEEDYKEIVVPAGSEESYRLLFELLMDIRELLAGQRDMTLRDKVEEAREEVEKKRQEQLKQRMNIT